MRRMAAARSAHEAAKQRQSNGGTENSAACPMNGYLTATLPPHSHSPPPPILSPLSSFLRPLSPFLRLLPRPSSPSSSFYPRSPVVPSPPWGLFLFFTTLLTLLDVYDHFTSPPILDLSSASESPIFLRLLSESHERTRSTV